MTEKNQTGEQGGALSAAGERCLVYLHLHNMTSVAFEKDVFYWQPEQSVTEGAIEPWYACQPGGKHKLSSMVITMCNEAGISERKSNHFLRVSLRHCTVEEYWKEKSNRHMAIELWKH